MSIFGQKNPNKETERKKLSFRQWIQFLKVLNLKEKWAFFISLLVFFGSLTFLLTSAYYKNTITVPSDSGFLKSGMVGQPQFINPLYAYSSNIDRALVEMIFSSLMTYDEQGNIVPDLIEEYRITDNGKTIEFSIKENVKWNDDKPLTVDDIVFTVHLVQDSDFMSPLRANWQTIEVEKTSDYKGLIKFKQPYSGALELLTNLKIMPQHIWENANFLGMTSNSELNLISPIGSGPYKISKVEQKENKSVKSVTLVANKNYYNSPAHIQKIQIIFFDSQDEIFNALKRGAITVGEIENSEKYDLEKIKNLNHYLLSSPDYFSIFFNNNKDPFKDKNIRIALTAGINKQEVLNKVLNNRGQIINSPLLSGFYNGITESEKTIAYDSENSNQLLNKAGFILNNGLREKTIQKTSGFKFSKIMQTGSTGPEVSKLQECLAQDPEIYPSGEIIGTFGENTKKAVIAFQEKYKDEILVPNGLSAGTGKVSAATIRKLNDICFVVPAETKVLSFKIKTGDTTTLITAANNLKEQWAKLGIQVEIEILNSSEMKRVIRERDFEVLLFGEKLGMIPDLLSYWHSSQIIDPGLNLAIYQNTDLDTLLEKQRTYSDFMNEERLKTLQSIQDILISDAPAVYLYSPYTIFIANKNLKGVELTKIADSSRIFSNIGKWYINEKRVWK